ncbi:MAG TPA: disulfide bond formation protein B [Xanthobacteraceae bacterium]|nr:disulfide bond formation protein B [Xanthobacteraceae bacterium]
MAALADTRKVIAQDPVFTIAWLIALAGAATIAGAWYFQYGLGLAPCPLCLEQRWPYYGAIPLALLIAVGARSGLNRRLLIAGLGLIALAMLWGAGLGVYHAGVEWKWWAGPQDCSGAGFSAGPAGNLLRQMQTARVVRCDEAPWRLLGLSLAGYNVLISLALAALAALGVGLGLRRYGSSSVSQ